MPRQMYRSSKFIILFFIRYVRNRIDHWCTCTVEPGNLNPRVHRSSGELGEASFPTGTVDPRVGISLSPLNTNDGFSLSTIVPGILKKMHLLLPLHFTYLSTPNFSWDRNSSSHTTDFYGIMIIDETHHDY